MKNEMENEMKLPCAVRIPFENLCKLIKVIVIKVKLIKVNSV